MGAEVHGPSTVFQPQFAGQESDVTPARISGTTHPPPTQDETKLRTAVSVHSSPQVSMFISVLLFVFLLQLTIHLLNSIGAQTINELVRSRSSAEGTLVANLDIAVDDLY